MAELEKLLDNPYQLATLETAMEKVLQDKTKVPNSKDRGKALALISTLAEQDGLQAAKRSLLNDLRGIEKMATPLRRADALFHFYRAKMHDVAKRAAALACPKSGAHATDVQLQLSRHVDAQLDSLERALKEILADSSSALRETSDALLSAICSAVSTLPEAAEKEVSDELEFEKRMLEMLNGRSSYCRKHQAASCETSSVSRRAQSRGHMGSSLATTAKSQISAIRI